MAETTYFTYFCPRLPMKRISIISLAAFLLLIIAGFLQNNHALTEAETISGRIIGGFRVLSIPENKQNIRLTVYRGDYLRFVHDGKKVRPVLSIPGPITA